MLHMCGHVLPAFFAVPSYSSCKVKTMFFVIISKFATYSKNSLHAVATVKKQTAETWPHMQVANAHSRDKFFVLNFIEIPPIGTETLCHSKHMLTDGRMDSVPENIPSMDWSNAEAKIGGKAGYAHGVIVRPQFRWIGHKANDPNDSVKCPVSLSIVQHCRQLLVMLRLLSGFWYFIALFISESLHPNFALIHSKKLWHGTPVGCSRFLVGATTEPLVGMPTNKRKWFVFISLCVWTEIYTVLQIPTAAISSLSYNSRDQWTDILRHMTLCPCSYTTDCNI